VGAPFQRAEERVKRRIALADGGEMLEFLILFF
jgi:hypothetical protein